MSPFQVAKLSPHRHAHPQSFPFVIFRASSKGDPPPQVSLTEFTQREMPCFQSPLTTIYQSSQWTDPPPRGNVRPLSPPPHILPDPYKGAPLTELLQREMLPFWTPQLSLKIPSQQTPQVPQQAPTETGTHFQNFLLPLSLKVPGKWTPPSMFPNRVPMERDRLLLQSQWFIHSFMSVGSPIRRPTIQCQWPCASCLTQTDDLWFT